MDLPRPVDQLIWHMAERRHWEEAQVSGLYRRSTRDADLAEVGFIHASSPEQLRGVAERFYSDIVEELVVLELDETALTAAGSLVRREPGDPDDPDSELFPHIYGPVPLSAVRRLYRASFDGEGQLVVVPESE